MAAESTVTVVQPSLPVSVPTQLASAVEAGPPPEPPVTVQALPSQHTAPGVQSPEFTLGLDNQTVTSGEAAVFTVFFQGRPAPSVQWFINGVLVHSSDRSVVGEVDGIEVVEDTERGTSTLTVLSSTTDNEAQYTCRVNNQWGSAFTNAHLFVLGKYLSLIIQYSIIGYAL